MKKTIYYDWASTAKPNIVALSVEREIQEKFWANPSSLHELGRNAKRKLEEARLDIAEIIGAKANEIYFTSGATESDNWAILNTIIAMDKQHKSHFVCSSFEHPAILRTLEKTHAEVTYVDPKQNGVIDPKDIEAAIDTDTAAVVCMLANNEIGTIQPIEKIGKICKKHNIPLICDATQAIGHIEIDVKKLGVTFLAASGHKFGSPRGIGFLYVEENFPVKPAQFGGGQEREMRSGTENVAGACAMARALKFSDNYAANSFNKDVLRSYHRFICDFIKNHIDDSILNCDNEYQLPTTVSVSFKDIDAQVLLVALDEAGICVSAGSACHSDNVEPSYVLTSIGVPQDHIMGSIRVTLSEDSTETDYEELNYFCETLAACVKSLR